MMLVTVSKEVLVNVECIEAVVQRQDMQTGEGNFFVVTKGGSYRLEVPVQDFLKELKGNNLNTQHVSL